MPRSNIIWYHGDPQYGAGYYVIGEDDDVGVGPFSDVIKAAEFAAAQEQAEAA